MTCPPPTPSAPYPFRWGLGPRAKPSSDKLDGNVPDKDNTSGEGSGVNALEGRLNADPLGVRTGEEEYNPFKELMDLVLGM